MISLDEVLRHLTQTEANRLPLQLLDAAPDAILVVDRPGTIRLANAQAEQLFGYARSELIGASVEMLLPKGVRDSHVHSRSDYFDRPRVRPMGSGMDLAGRRKDGTEVPVEVSLSPLHVGENLIVIAAIRDVSERRREKDELRRAKELAESANRAKGIFLANVSHEIRTPLSVIIGFLEFLDPKADTTEADRSRYLDIIRKNAAHLLALIGNILDMAKVESGELTPTIEELSIEELVDTLTGPIRADAATKRVAFEVLLAPDLPPLVRADGTKIRQILLNLVSNAVKFTEEGFVRLEIRWLADRDAVEFTVVDTGCGIAPEEHETVFEVFRQGGRDFDTPARPKDGAGLGLALVKRLTEILGGTIELQSEPGSGSRFRVTLPARPVTTPANTAPAPPVPPGTASLREKRILIADDYADSRALFRAWVARYGIGTVDFASNGREAIDLALEARAESRPHDVILLDIEMPEKSGFEVASELRSLGFRTRIVAITAYALARDRHRCLDAGCDQYLAKPVNEEQIRNIILACLGEERDPSPGRESP